VAFLGRREDFTTLVVFRYDRLARTFGVALRCIAFLLEAFRSCKRCFSLQLIPFSSDVLVAFFLFARKILELAAYTGVTLHVMGFR
jgi:hypothetical protein